MGAACMRAMPRQCCARPAPTLRHPAHQPRASQVKARQRHHSSRLVLCSAVAGLHKPAARHQQASLTTWCKIPTQALGAQTQRKIPLPRLERDCNCNNYPTVYSPAPTISTFTGGCAIVAREGDLARSGAGRAHGGCSTDGLKATMQFINCVPLCCSGVTQAQGFHGGNTPSQACATQTRARCAEAVQHTTEAAVRGGEKGAPPHWLCKKRLRDAALLTVAHLRYSDLPGGLPMRHTHLSLTHSLPLQYKRCFSSTTGAAAGPAQHTGRHAGPCRERC